MGHMTRHARPYQGQFVVRIGCDLHIQPVGLRQICSLCNQFTKNITSIGLWMIWSIDSEYEFYEF